MRDAPTDHHLDRPLLETMRFEALHDPPARADVERIRQQATLGWYGPDQLAAVDARSPRPLTMGLFVGGLFAFIPLIVVVFYLVRGELDTAGAGAVLTLVLFVVPGALGVLGATVTRRNRWRRHTQVALFAEQNGLRLQLVASPESLPPAVLTAGPVAGLVHADVVTGFVQGQEVSIGVRSATVTRSDETRSVHLVWAALRLDPVWASQATGWHRLAGRVDGLRPDERRLDLWRDDDWVVLGLTGPQPSLDVVPALVSMIDVALATQNGELA